jgi:CBS domain-containing protein
MPIVQDVLAVKGSMVHTTDPDATVLAAVQYMNHHKLGALIVMQDGQVKGIFTERDVLRRVLGELLDPKSTKVGSVMTPDVICVEPETDLDEVSSIMRQKRIRHLPVCADGGRLRGMVSIGDLNAYHASDQQAHITFLNDYIYGRV